MVKGSVRRSIWHSVLAAAALSGYAVGATVPLPSPAIDKQALHAPTFVLAKPFRPAILDKKPNG